MRHESTQLTEVLRSGLGWIGVIWIGEGGGRGQRGPPVPVTCGDASDRGGAWRHQAGRNTRLPSAAAPTCCQRSEKGQRPSFQRGWLAAASGASSIPRF